MEHSIYCRRTVIFRRPSSGKYFSVSGPVYSFFRKFPSTLTPSVTTMKAWGSYL